MTVRFFFLIAGFFALLQCTLVPSAYAGDQPDQCTNPIVVSSIIITNATCGNASGVILMSLAGGNNGYTFTWQPNVSGNNVASGLVAGAYSIHIVRNSDPACTLDTTVIVNNSDGPGTQTTEILPANCLAANGKITMSPPGFNYTWSNGETGSVNTDLTSGCYFVTATNPGNGCYSVLKVCVPNKNLLQSSFQIIEPAKCGLPTGSGQVHVTGGSGQYSYSFGNSAVATNLAPGAYTFFIADNVSGCLDTLAAIMTDAPLSGEVIITPHNIKCTGQGNGNVEFEVVPGSNFKQPYTFALWDQDGNPQSPGALAAGVYYLQIADADSCLLPVDSFTIAGPPVFAATTTVQAVSCDAGGQIQLQLSGGNGRYIVDWADLPGFDNPRDRLNLEGGYFSATVYDSLFCAYPVNAVLVPAYCDIPDTLTLIVATNSAGSLCLTPPAGVDNATLTYSIVSQNEIFGDWTLSDDGCVTYQAGPVAKFGVDPICVAVKSTVPGLSDTVCVWVNITTAPAEKDSIYFAVQAGNSGTACGFVPPNFSNRVIALLDGQGLDGTSDAFGIYTIDPVSACITFESYGQTGYNVDGIGVGVCDTVIRQCREIYYFPSVLSPNDCLDGIHLPDSLTLATSDCDAGASACVPIPFAQILDYSILDNGQPYSGGQLSGCNQNATIAYSIKLNGGPYQLTEWTVNNQVFSGFFVDRFELLGLMNQYDPVPGWTLEGDSIFIGGDTSITYGLMKIISAQDQFIEASPGQKHVFSGTLMPFATGQHTLIFRRVQTGCLDTMLVRVICTDCPPVHNNIPNNQGDFLWNIAQCSGDTLFCTNLTSQGLAEYTITDNGLPFSSYSFCGNNVALRLDTGTHVLHLQHNNSSCDYDIKVTVTCSGGAPDSTLLAVPDVASTLKNTAVEIALLVNDIILGITGNTAGLQELVILSNPPNGAVTYDDFLGIVTYTPFDDFCGTDTFSYRITDIAGMVSATQVSVTVVCDKVLVFNGISPNGDNKNDFWHIVGIEQFPGNEVRVFNRWGNLVFEQKGYTNQNAWSGTWNGKDLPDGAYFYMIDLGDGSPVLSGYIQLMR